MTLDDFSIALAVDVREYIDQRLAEFRASLPIPEKGDKGDKGDSVIGPVGPQGERGEPGAAGGDGPVGPIGPSGEKGERGVDGRDGRDGKDGIASRDEMKALISEAVAEAVPLAVKAWGTEWASQQPEPINKGVWQEGESYNWGNYATWGGSQWHANRKTTDKPGTSDAWTLVVKRGRDGKDAPKA